MKQHLARLVTALIGLTAVLALPGTAFAYTSPDGPDSGATVPLTPVVGALHAANATAPVPSSGSWAPALSVGVVLGVVLALAITFIAQRARRQRHTHRPAFGV